MRTYYLRSFGCQMNEHDAERIRFALEGEGLVGVVGRGCLAQAPRLEERADALGVVLVHLAAERAKVVVATHGVLVAVAGRRTGAAPATWRCRRRGSRG
jgi:hypothetical protein